VTDLHTVWHDAERVSQVCRHLKKINFEIQDGGRPKRLRDPLCIIMRYCSLLILKTAAVRHLGILKLKFLTTSYFRHAFSIITFNFVKIGRTVAQISHFVVFSSEM